MTEIQVPSPNGEFTLTVSTDQPLFIVGRNGAGKSALVQHIFQRSGLCVTYLPGNRPSIFDGEALNLTPQSRRDMGNNFGLSDYSPDTRWRNFVGNFRNEKAIHDLTILENKYKNDLANAISDQRDVNITVARLQEKVSPLDKVNRLIEQANIPVRLAMDDGELKATAAGKAFSIARMSDGERTALIFIAEVVTAVDGTVFVIDEPELHLHRSIVVPLISSLIKTRPTCEFVVSTHELDLPSSVAMARICIVRSVKWGPQASVESWDIDTIDNAGELPEDLITDILGSRRRVLFTEGTDQSLDIPMYAILFPKASVRPKGSCTEVQRLVAGINSTVPLHRTAAFGLVDNDGMSPEQIADRRAEGVYALSVFSVESLYYAPEVVEAVATRQAATMAARAGDQQTIIATYLADAIECAVAAASVPGIAENLAARIAERHVRDTIIGQLPKREEIVAGNSRVINIDGQSYPAELSRLRALISANKVFEIIARYPVRHSGILSAIAKALKFQNRSDYEAAALARLSSDENLRAKLLAKLGDLPTVLNDGGTE